MELRPLRGTHICGDRDASTFGGVIHDLSVAELETEPVADVSCGGGTQVGFGLLVGGLAVDVDVEASADADVAGQQGSGALEDPALVGEVETFEQSVVGELALQLCQCPATGCSHGLQPSGERRAESDGRAVGAVRHATGPKVMPSGVRTTRLSSCSRGDRRQGCGGPRRARVGCSGTRRDQGAIRAARARRRGAARSGRRAGRGSRRTCRGSRIRRGSTGRRCARPPLDPRSRGGGQRRCGTVGSPGVRADRSTRRGHGAGRGSEHPDAGTDAG